MHKQAITMESEQAGSRSKQRVFLDIGGLTPALRWESCWRRTLAKDSAEQRREDNLKEERIIQVKGAVGAKVWKQTRAWCMVGPTCFWNLQKKVLEEAGRVRSKSRGTVESPLRNGDALKGLK